VLNLRRVHDVWQMDIQKTNPLVQKPSLFELKIAIGNLEIFIYLGTNQMPAELNKPRGENFICLDTQTYSF
jgi:hypothetical protein